MLGFALAKRLREMGKVQTAFLCGKRAVELKPVTERSPYVVRTSFTLVYFPAQNSKRV